MNFLVQNLELLGKRAINLSNNIKKGHLGQHNNNFLKGKGKHALAPN
jgi:hypothetical protein